MGLEEITAGTKSTDVKCGRETPVTLIAGITAGVIVIVFIVIVAIIFTIRHKKGPSTGKFHINPSLFLFCF